MSIVLPVVSMIVSVAALLVALWAHLRQQRIQARMLVLEEAREKDRVSAKGKAVLTAHMIHRGNGVVLRIENSGQAEARDIKLFLDGKPILEHPVINERESEIQQVGPRSHCDYPLLLCFGKPIPSSAEITWSDDSGERGSYRTTVTL